MNRLAILILSYLLKAKRNYSWSFLTKTVKNGTV